MQIAMFRVFLSSPFKGHESDRRRITEVLLAHNCFPAAVEFFGAFPRPPLEMVQAEIDLCDFFVLILKGLVGSLEPRSKKPYCQKEFEYARRKKKPILAFVYEGTEGLPPEETETDSVRLKALQDLKAMVQAERVVVQGWQTTEELATKVGASLHRAIQGAPGAGWVRRPPDAGGDRAGEGKKGVTVEDLATVLRGSRFARRLLTERRAKESLAELVVARRLIDTEGVTFMDSGTLPVYLVLQMLRDARRKPGPTPRMVTNNIAVAILEMIAGGHDLDQTLAPKIPEGPLRVELMGGAVMENYAATLPEDILGAGKQTYESQALMESWAASGVNHLVLMTTKLALKGGLCAVAHPVRWHRRSALRFALDHPEVRVSVLAEVSKIVADRGDECAAPEYWRELIKQDRIELICAFGDLDARQRRDSEEAISELRRQHLRVTIADDEGGDRHGSSPSAFPGNDPL